MNYQGDLAISSRVYLILGIDRALLGDIECGNIPRLVERLMNKPGDPCKDFSIIAHCTASYVLSYFGEKVSGLLAPSFTEPGGGSDLRNLSTHAILVDDKHLSVSGEKIFTTNATKAKQLIVLAASNKGYVIGLIDTNNPGVEIEPLDIDAYKCSGIGRVVYRGAKGRIIGDPGKDAYKAALQSIAISRLLIAAHAAGLAGQVLGKSLETLVKRSAWRHQAPRHRIAHAYALLESSRSYIKHVAHSVAHSPWSFDWRLTSIAKYVAVEAARQVAEAVITSMGGIVLLRGSKILDILKNIYALFYAEGTQDIQLEIIARSIEKQFGLH